MESDSKFSDSTQAIAKSHTFALLRQIGDARARNLLRGILANESTGKLSTDTLNRVRQFTPRAEMVHVATLLLGKDGLRPRLNARANYSALFDQSLLTDVSAEAELGFIIGHLNGWSDAVLALLDNIKALSTLPELSPSEAIRRLHQFAETWGASNFLAKKIAYVMSQAEATSDLTEQLNNINELLGQSERPAPYFSALEAIDEDYPYFPGMLSKIRMLWKDSKKDDYRRYISLHNIVPTPVTLTDVGSFLRVSFAHSFVDEVVSLVQLHILSHQWRFVEENISTLLNPSILLAVRQLASTEILLSRLKAYVEPWDEDLSYYRRSIAFLEYREPCVYRNFIDRIVGPRLLPIAITGSAYDEDVVTPPIGSLLGKLVPENSSILGTASSSLSTFTRTIYTLIVIQNYNPSSSIDYEHLLFIFNNTMALDILMPEAELKRLYATADGNTRALIAILALSLYKARTSDEDVDFEFRKNFCDTINYKYDGSIPKFFTELVGKAPQVANFLLSTLDKPTLQKLYWVVGSPDEADKVRQEILRIVGRSLKKIEYFVEADTIEAQRQVSKLKRYFDDSRMYVDSAAMKKWLSEHPTSYTQQYLRDIEQLVQAIMSLDKNSKNYQHELDVITSQASSIASIEYMLREMAQMAFTQFCTNTTFGIESYLGRRIRHNTLSGVMRGGVESLIDKPQFQPLKYEKRFSAANSAWLVEYKAEIESLRREILQFNSPQKTKGIFFSDLRLEDENTKTNISMLRSSTLVANGAEMLNDFLVRFCWQQIDPQLRAASQRITSEQLNRALSSLDKHLGEYNGELYRKFQTEVRDVVYDRFSQLGSWFRQPESGFVTATTKELYLQNLRLKR